MECRLWISFTLFLILSTITVKRVDAIGTIFVRFIKYENPTGRASNGVCCDGKYGLCQIGGCDNIFEICFDQANETLSSTEVCRLGKFKSEAILNENSNNFGQTIGKTLKNPIQLNAGEIPETFQLKVNVEDEDSITKNEKIDFLSKTLNLTYLGIVSPASSSIFPINARTTLVIEIYYECESEWFGSRCNVMCENPSNNDHYKCNETTGEKICNTNWIGPNCATLNPCYYYNCQNNGNCSLDEYRNPTCTCEQNFKGPYCEMRKCNSQWYGPTCDVSCKDPSENDHYTCDTTSGAKICEHEWYDHDCQIYCKTPRTYENYECNKQTGKKQCHEGWVGPSCNTVNPCIYYNHCQNRGTCTLDEFMNPKCLCSSNYEGVLCEMRKCDQQWYGSNCDVLCQNPSESDHYICNKTTGVKICDTQWYDSMCNVFCREPLHQSDHYVCNQITGSKICKKGWVGQTCSTIDQCQFHHCENNGFCTLDEYLNATCICPKDYSGAHCEFKICADDWYGPNCATHCRRPSTNEHYTCNEKTGAKVCNEGWVGSDCSTVNPCIIFECQNDGTCVFEENRGPVCNCPSKFAGVHCEIKKCDTYCMPGRCYSFANQDLFMCICDKPDGQGQYLEDRIDENGMPFKCPVQTTTIATTTTTTEKEIIPVSPSNVLLYRTNMDCDALAKIGYRYQDKLYDIQPIGDEVFTVWCDMDSEGWTVIQRRYGDGISFNRDWESYKKSFGDPTPNHSFWIGLEHLYHLTTQRWYTLSITLQMPDRTFKYANYQYFYIENEENGYRLHVYGHSGTAGDALITSSVGASRIHNNMKFTTYDKDNDKYLAGNCAYKYQSGWWFNDCYLANLNGVYKKYTNGWPKCHPSWLCVAWQNTGRYSPFSLTSVIMKVKPTNPPSNEIIELMKRGY